MVDFKQRFKIDQSVSSYIDWSCVSVGFFYRTNKSLLFETEVGFACLFSRGRGEGKEEAVVMKLIHVRGWDCFFWVILSFFLIL